MTLPRRAPEGGQGRSQGAGSAFLGRQGAQNINFNLRLGCLESTKKYSIEKEANTFSGWSSKVKGYLGVPCA